MADLNLTAAWLGILAGMATGAVYGLRFQDDGWLGGYASWPRRLLRLGHISLFGIALINLAFALTAARMGWGSGCGRDPRAASLLLAAGAGLMPLSCGLAAWRRGLRPLFALPVGCLMAAAGLVLRAVAAPAALAGMGGAP
jgi:hypothetical protein